MNNSPRRDVIFIDEWPNLTWAQIAEGCPDDPRVPFLSALIVYLIDSDIPPNEDNITKVLEFIRGLEASKCMKNS